MAAKSYVLRFWGVRGTIPTPVAANLRYGGNTSCLSVALGEDEHLILDCGSGLRSMGKALGPPRAGKTRRFHILLSHYHFDHVEGLAYFPPLWDAGTEIAFHGFEPAGRTVRDTLEGLVAPPYFPVSLSEAPARRTYATAGAERLQFGDLTVSSLHLNHPQGCVAWRLEHAGRHVVFATDHEHGDPEVDRGLERFSEGAELLIYDATYIPSEYEILRRGWGHSTWYAAVGLARRNGVRRLVLFHHHPDHTDEELERLLMLARAEFPECELAREGMEHVF